MIKSCARQGILSKIEIQRFKMNNKKSRYQKGFTLIEVMITVAILGILSAIAIPSYSESVKKGKRSDAKVTLLRLAQMQESYFVQKLSYAKDLDQLGFTGKTSIESDEGLYDITFFSVTAGCTGDSATACTEYALQAVPVTGGSQANDTRCTGFQIDNFSRKYAKGSGSTSYGTSTAQIAKTRECW